MYCTPALFLCGCVEQRLYRSEDLNRLFDGVMQQVKAAEPGVVGGGEREEAVQRTIERLRSELEVEKE